ncbi:MAG TPA: hypothetical protein DEA96_07610 [Leptospiraceae bacterium]|nr:hypothetical protein [Spirochaetaceae bacterium]HBS04812.1 hypothetical protein [Leptospiraceae bacterium]
MRLHYLTLLFPILLQCASPTTPGNQAQTSADKDVPGIPIELQKGISKSYKFAGSCEFPEGFCAQLYSPDVVDAATMLVLMVRRGSCRLVQIDQGESHCQDRPRYGRCLLDPVQPGGAPDGTLVQMDIYYGAPPDHKEQRSCNEKGTYYPPMR